MHICSWWTCWLARAAAYGHATAWSCIMWSQTRTQMSIDYPVSCFRLKMAFNHFVRPDCIDHSPTAQMNSGWCHRRISDYSVQSISNGEMKHHHSCPLILMFICWISFLLRQLVWRSSLHRLRAFNACAKRGVSVFSLYKIPLHPGPPVGAVATELPTHSNSSAHDKPAPRARTCRTWVNKRIRAKPVNCGQ